jgi:hypothetical protein
MSQKCQTEKNSVRAHVFRFALELGHFSTQLACHKRAISGHAFLQNSFARFIDVQHWMRPAQLARVGPDRRRNRPPRDVSSPHRAF